MATELAQQKELFDLGRQQREAQAAAARDDLGRQLRGLESQTAWEQEDVARQRKESQAKLPQQLEDIGSNFAARGSYYSGRRGTEQANYKTELSQQLDNMQRTADRSGFGRHLQAEQGRVGVQRTLDELHREGRAAELQRQLSLMGGGGGGGGGGGYRSGGGGRKASEPKDYVGGNPVVYEGSVAGGARAATFDPAWTDTLRNKAGYGSYFANAGEFFGQTGGKGSDSQFINWMAGQLAAKNGSSFEAAKKIIMSKPQQLSQAIADYRAGRNPGQNIAGPVGPKK